MYSLLLRASGITCLRHVSISRKVLLYGYCACGSSRVCFKLGIVIPAFKGKGRDPLLIKSYRCITLTSVLAKVFEILLLNRMSPILEDAGVPQLTQTAYRKKISCSDSIFAGHEVISRFAKEGDHVYSCFYDLSNAFDTVEFCVLLEQLSHAGVKGKCWRLIKDWYKNLHTQVRLCPRRIWCFPWPAKSSFVKKPC